MRRSDTAKPDMSLRWSEESVEGGGIATDISLLCSEELEENRGQRSEVERSEIPQGIGGQNSERQKKEIQKKNL